MCYLGLHTYYIKTKFELDTFSFWNSNTKLAMGRIYNFQYSHCFYVEVQKQFISYMFRSIPLTSNMIDIFMYGLQLFIKIEWMTKFYIHIKRIKRLLKIYDLKVDWIQFFQNYFDRGGKQIISSKYGEWRFLDMKKNNWLLNDLIESEIYNTKIIRIFINHGLDFSQNDIPLKKLDLVHMARNCIFSDIWIDQLECIEMLLRETNIMKHLDSYAFQWIVFENNYDQFDEDGGSYCILYFQGFRLYNMFSRYDTKGYVGQIADSITDEYGRSKIINSRINVLVYAIRFITILKRKNI